MKRELIEDTIQKYQDLLDDEEHFQREISSLEQQSNNGKNGSEKELNN